MSVPEHIQKIFNLLEGTHSDSQHRKLLYGFIVWMLLCAFFYGFKYGEENIAGDLVHQVTTALNRVDPSIFSKDYIYSDPLITAFYSPQQIGSIATLYRLTGSISVALASLQFLYSAILVLGAWLVAKQLTRNIWVMLIFMLTILQFSMMTLKGGWTWGILRGPFPVFMPVNWILARGLLLAFILLTLLKKQSFLTAQAAILGLLFLIHAPTGLTLTIGATPYFIWKLIDSPNRFKDFAKWTGAFFAGASFFLINFWVNSPISVPLTSAENSLLYDIWLYRLPDDYPHTFWRLFTLGDLEWDWAAHTALIVVTLSALWGIIKKNGAILLASTGLLLGYIYGLEAIPLVFLILAVSYWGRENLKSLQTSTWSLGLIIYGAFFVCTWLQWAYDIYHSTMRTPPFIIDNQRFVTYLFPFAFVIFSTATKKFKKWGLLIAAYGILTLPLLFHSFDPLYQNIASDHNVKFRAQFDFNPRFSLSKSDNYKVLEFAKKSPKGSLFLYYSNSMDSWYFRLRARRPIALNANDLGWKYYSKKKELVSDWLIYTRILEAYRNRDLERLCKTTKDLAIDFIVFPTVESKGSSCFNTLLDMESGAIYSLK
jgi:hypothetical protein